jgi:hypothetical protein
MHVGQRICIEFVGEGDGRREGGGRGGGGGGGTIFRGGGGLGVGG